MRYDPNQEEVWYYLDGRRADVWQNRQILKRLVRGYIDSLMSLWPAIRDSVIR